MQIKIHKMMVNEIGLLKARIKQLEDENEVLLKQQVEINQAKELYLKIFEEFPALIWRAGLDKACNHFNKTWLDFTGRTLEQETGNGWTEGVHPEDFDFCLQTYITSFDKREAFLMEYRLKDKFGEYRWIRDFGRPFYDIDNTFLGYIGSCYDVTDNKNNELKLIELNATKDKFFSIIAHDLRNPFHNILGYAELLNKNHSKYNEIKMCEVTSNLLLSTKNTYILLENLLEWSKTQLNRVKFEPQVFNFIQLCNEIIDSVKSHTLEKEITIRCFTTEKIEVYADVDLFKIIVRNLISNAIKYSNRNGAINIFAEKDGGEVTITVSDNGVGIAQDRKEKLFDLSYTSSTRGTANEVGTGLGLILCKEFVEKHKGRIWVESNLEKGSEFNFTLPVFQS